MGQILLLLFIFFRVFYLLFEVLFFYFYKDLTFVNNFLFNLVCFSNNLISDFLLVFY